MPAKKSDKKTTSKADNVGKGLLIGAGLAAVSAAGYLLYGPKGAKNRSAIKAWGVKAKGEVIEKIEKLKDVTEDKYHKIVDAVAAKYGKSKDVNKDEISNFVQEAKNYWKSIEKDAKKAQK